METTQGRHYLFTLKELGDIRGGMIAITGEEDVPFAIKRIFYSYKTGRDEVRGNHANIRSSFVMISVSGSCIVEVDEGNCGSGCRTGYLLDSPEKALFIGKGLWKTMREFSEDNVLLVLSDCAYDPDEYIRDYDDYLKLLNDGKQAYLK